MSSNRDFDREVTFEIVEEIGVIATHSTGWKKELNLVSWNGGQAKYDIRDWDPGHSRMSRGVTLKEQEMRQIVELLRRRRPHRRDREQEQGVMVDTPMDPAEAAKAALNGRGYPFFSISGIMMAPTAEQVAIAEPEIAAKNIQAAVVTKLSPPVIHPIQVSAKLTILFATPPVLIKLPARIKKGIAISEKEFTPLTQFCVIIANGVFVKPAKTTKVANAIE